MKKILFVAIIAVMTLATVFSATALSNSKGVLFDRIANGYYAQAGDTVQYRVQAHSDVFTEDVRVRAYVPDLGIIASDGRFDLGSSRRTSHLQLQLPDDTESGCYIVRFSISNDDIRRTKHRWVCVH